MKVGQIRLLQQGLKDEGLNPGPVDGVLGDQSRAAVALALAKRQDFLPSNWQGWTDKRRSVACLQFFCREHGIEVGVIDGLWGPQTEFGVDSLTHLTTHGEPPPLWRDIVPGTLNPHDWPNRDEAALVAYYGEAGSNQTAVAAPFSLRLSWDRKKIVNSFSCHRLVRDSIATILARILAHYGTERIRELGLDLWGGCLNVRKERGGSNWSTHAWGIAVDFNPDRNQLIKWGRDRAVFARPEYDAWWGFWEEEGWVSLVSSQGSAVASCLLFAAFDAL